MRKQENIEELEAGDGVTISYVAIIDGDDEGCEELEEFDTEAEAIENIEKLIEFGKKEFNSWDGKVKYSVFRRETTHVNSGEVE